ncbi:MAG TPA: type II toxin-antitoxin system PemK/MazF family toxin [Candidatus Wunengus sp. YC63]|uniref:type II toxin-antitoxin system PemK/MazF family toxin n=1 Tax=unclassified Candidatus Wunengus TaxID=3367695 RepID=UPI004028E7D2
MELKKGDIVLVQAPANPSGTEIQKTRPAVVVSPKEMAIHGSRAIVVPITGNVSKIYPFEFLIKSKYLSNDSKGCCDQIQTVSTKRIIKKYGDISNSEMVALDKALKNILRLK